MPEYTEITCRSNEAANATHAYLLSQLNEDEAAPLLTARVEGIRLRITYERNGEPQRDAWDKQLIGFRDGFELCQPFYEAPLVDSEHLRTALSDDVANDRFVPFDVEGSARRTQATKDAVSFVNNALGI